MWYTKVIYAVLLIIGFVFSILYDGIFSLLLMGTLLLLPLTQFWMIHHVRRRISITLSMKQVEIERNAKEKLYCTLQNRSRIPLNYCHVTLNLENQTAGEIEPLELQLPLQGKFSAAVSFQFASPHCGKLHFSVKKCKIMDYLHLFSCSVRKCNTIDCMVLPSEQAEELVMQNLNRSDLEESVLYDPYRPGDDNTEMFGIREFQDTDHPKRIHWKRSSREENLFVKEYSRPLEKQCCIWIDRQAPDDRTLTGAELDAQLECAHALACIFLRQQVPFVIVWNTEDAIPVQPITTQEQLQQCMVQILKQPISEQNHRLLQESALIPVGTTYAMLFHIAHTASVTETELNSVSRRVWHLLTHPNAQRQEQCVPITLETLPSVLADICNAL